MSGSLLTPTDTSAEVREAAELAARHAADADLARRLPGEVVEALVAAGFARHFVPVRWGGRAGGFEELLDTVSTVGEGCTSAAWIATVTSGAARMGVCLPEEGQGELWSGGADTVVVGALNPTGRAAPVPGGWRLTGEWPLVSGVDFADWTLVCALAPLRERETALFLAVPRRDYRVADTWFNVGMRATGSNTLIAEGVFVPEHRSVARDDILRGRAVGSDARCHTAPLRAVSGPLFAAPALGAARAAVRTWSARMAGKPGQNGKGAPRDNPSVQGVLARAEGEIESAALLLRRAARTGDEGFGGEGERARAPRDCALAADQLVDAVERLFRSAGSGAQAQDDPLQRIWRDVHCVASHAALRFETAGSAYGGQLLRAGDELPEHHHRTQQKR
ncbi:acyl-CoA dehydrogenase family protein [Streptomyces cupreus]|uniref:Hydrolase n=1 Tax=Streptomyces cupreus TaxID=2759956 RepID=A0A7X1J9S2_9ACTN|nr:acyl-CoA dehydrogenase family protein [Streptomyces cupreus]MBC2906290.1 hydrolase [Streptomyces cupreus]